MPPPSGSTPILHLPYPIPDDTVDVPRDIKALADRLDPLLGGIVTALPGSPIDGQEIYYQSPAMATDGNLWHLRYRAAAAGASKWEFVGGAALFGETPDAEGGAPNGSYGALPHAGPAVTLPLPGDYLVEIGAGFTGTVDMQGRMSYDIGATGAVDADAVFARIDSTARQFSGSRARRKTALGAGALIAKYKVSAAGGHLFQDRWIKVTPIRVG